MWWNNIAKFSERLEHVEEMLIMLIRQYNTDELKEIIEEASNKIRDSVADVEEYTKNVDKLNGMVNEFKGCISMARGSAVASSSKMMLEKIDKLDEVLGTCNTIINIICNKLDQIEEAIYRKSNSRSRDSKQQ